MAAGIATLSQLNKADYIEMNKKLVYLTTNIKQLAEKFNIPLQIRQRGTMWGFFFNEQPVQNFDDSKASNHKYFAEFYRELLTHGVYLAPSQYETNFISKAHTDQDIADTIDAFKATFEALANKGIRYE